MSLTSGSVQSGHGLKLCYKTQISYNTLCGMHANCQGSAGNQALGSDSLMNHGQQISFGKFRCVWTVLYPMSN